MENKWYIWPTDACPRTNNYVVQVIHEQNPEYAHSSKLCADKVERDMFECPNGYSDVRKAISAIGEYHLRFEIFVQRGDNLPVRYNLWKRSVQKEARKKKLLSQHMVQSAG
jgi:hypothetical protein